MVLVQKEIKKVYLGTTQVRPVIPPYLCFTNNNTYSGTIKITKTGNPTTVSLETSTDGKTRSGYTIGTAITVNGGDKLYWRNTSTTDTGFSIGASGYYSFEFGGNGDFYASGNVNYLLNKNSTTTLSAYCFFRLFRQSYLYSAPRLPATTLSTECYSQMFYNCIYLQSLPELPASTLADRCYQNMFARCSNICLSATQTGTYQTPYRIPTTGTGTTASSALDNMFSQTGGTFTGTPSINTTYYTSNTVV